jgi:hypothetical protein
MTMNMFRINIFALLTVAMITTAAAQSTTTFQDSMGRDIGRATTHGNTTTFYDRSGRETVAPSGATTARRCTTTWGAKSAAPFAADRGLLGPGLWPFAARASRASPPPRHIKR